MGKTSHGDGVREGEREERGRKACCSELTGYLSTSTIHGISHATNPHNSACHRTFWMILILMSTAAVTFAVHQFIRSWLYPAVYNHILYVEKSSLPFPLLTVCSMSMLTQEYVDDNLAAQRLIHLWYPNLGPFIYDSPGDRVKAERINMADYNVTQAVMEGSPLTAGSGVVTNVILPQSMNLHDINLASCDRYTTQVMSDKGLCHRINLNLTVTASGRSSFVILVFEFIKDDDPVSRSGEGDGSYVIIHGTEDCPASRASPAVIIKPNTETMLHLSMKIKESLTRLGECEDTNSRRFVNPLQYYDHYTAKGCRLECERRLIVDACGCKLLSHPGTDRVCVTEKETSCSNNCSLDACFHQCIPACQRATYMMEQTHSDLGSSQFSKIYTRIGQFLGNKTHPIATLLIVTDTLNVMIEKQTEAFTFSDLWGNVGGVMGLLLGASLLSVVELLQALYLSLYHCLVKRRAPLSPPQDGEKDMEMSER